MAHLVILSLSFFFTLVFKLVTLTLTPHQGLMIPLSPHPLQSLSPLTWWCHPHWGEVKSECSFHLHSPDGKGWWTLFHISRPFVLLLKAVWSSANQLNIPHFEMLPMTFLVPISGIIPALRHYLNSFVSIFNTSCI